MPLRTCSMRTLPDVAGSSFGVCFGPRVRCQTNVLGMRGLLALGARPIPNRVRLDATLARGLLDGRQTLEPFHRRLDHVVRVRRPETLRQNVGNAGALHDRAHRTTGNHAGARCRRLHEHATSTMLADDLVRDGPAGQRHAHHAAARGIDSLSNGLRHLVRFARSVPDFPLPVADGDESVERETPPTLHDLRDTVDRDDVLDELAPVAPGLDAATLTVTGAAATAAVTSPRSAAFAATPGAATATAATRTTTAAARSAATAAIPLATTRLTAGRGAARSRPLILCHVRTPARLRGRRRPPPSRGRGICTLRDRTRPVISQRPSPSVRSTSRPRPTARSSCPRACGPTLSPTSGSSCRPPAARRCA